MGLSSNQARFLSLTARQIDLEHRVQQICQRRLRLSNDLQRAANAYNDQTSDRRLYINTLNSYSSANNVIGNITHDNISDNQQYELLSPNNLYDNGLHLFINGELLEMDGSGMMRIATGNTNNITRTSAPYYNVGDWSDNTAPLYWKVMSKTLNTPDITIPVPADSGAHSNENTTIPTVGAANTTQINGPWTGSGLIQDPMTGIASQTFTRSCSVENDLGTQIQAVPITQITQAQLGTSNDNKTINGVVFNKYTYTDYTNTSVTRYAIGDQSEAQAITQLNALATAGFDITDNFILMKNVNMPIGSTWGIIDSFSGIFDGNLYSIDDLRINNTNGDTNLGMFGSIGSSGVVKNLNLGGITIKTPTDPLSGGSWNLPVNYNYIGGLAGQSLGTISNCHLSDLLIVTDCPGVKIGGIVGESGSSSSNAILTNCSATGTIHIEGEGHQVGGLAGLSSGGNILFSSADVDIKTNVDSNIAGLDGNSSHIGSLIGDVDNGSYGNTNSIKYCYASGLINGHNTSIGSVNQLAVGLTHPDTITSLPTPHNIVSYCYCGNPGTGNNPPTTIGVYDNTPGRSPDAGATWNDIKNAQTIISGVPVNVWNANGTLNTAAINTEVGTFDMKSTTTWTETITKTDNPGVKYNIAEFEDSTFDPLTLEPGLRNGSIKLAKHASPLTQEVISPIGTNETFEYVDWRVVPIIADDLYKVNDEEAQYQYEKITREVNTQDKQLQLEQTSVETEYNAVRSEKEAVEKVIDANAKSSFKYFS